jgi:hypothetical protein
MVWALWPVVQERPEITDGSIDEIKAWPNICDALHLVANSGKASDGKIVALKQALKRLDRRSDNVAQLPPPLNVIGQVGSVGVTRLPPPDIIVQHLTTS